MNEDVLTFTVIPCTSLTGLACLWLFFKYITEPEKNSGFSMVIILAISDLIYSTTLFSNCLFPDHIGGNIFYLISLSTLYFSIYWAGTISVFVYQTVRDKNPISNQHLLKGLLVTLTIASLSGFLWFQKLSYHELFYVPDFALYAPPGFALLLTSVFYWKSIKTLRTQPECELKSMRQYIRNLKYHSVSQIITCAPIIILFAAISVFNSHEVRIPPVLQYAALIAQTLSCLSGFMNALIYLKLGRVKNNSDLMEYMNTDLTNDTFC